jgi:broad specificity phosphatase PhoE
VADRLAISEVRAIYSSPFRRSIETAMPLAERLNLEIRVRPDIVEHFWEGFANLQHFQPCTLEQLTGAWSRVRLDPALPAGCWDWPTWPESVETLAARMRKFVDHLKVTWGDHNDDAVVVFSHGAPVARGLEAWILDTPGPEFRFAIANATINLVRFRDGVSTMLALNEGSHLGGEGSG